MDFSLTEEQQAIQDLSRQILKDQVTVASLKELDSRKEWFHRKAWAELARAGLFGAGLPESIGGGGGGIIEICLLLQEVGRTVAPIPVFPTLVLGALPIGRFGTAEQMQRYLPGVVQGDTFLTAALVEVGADDPSTPYTTAEADGEGFRLYGTKICVPAAHLAHRILVPARTSSTAVGVFLVDPKATGVTLAALTVTSGEPQYKLTLTGAHVPAADVLGDLTNGRSIATWIEQHAQVGVCALELGVTEQALRMTAEYTSSRVQFDRPIATFQAVAQRAADAYIDVDCIRLCLWQAAWRLAEGMSSIDEVAVAKFWAAEGGQRVVLAAQHLHGGIGFDRDYPLHRYFLWSKQLELTLGSATSSLARIGQDLGNQPIGITEQI